MNSMIYVGLPSNIQFCSRGNIKSNDPLEIIKSVCYVLNVSIEDIIGKTRKREVVEARYIAIGIIFNSNDRITKVNIGKIFNRDHSTVIYSLRIFDDLLSCDKSFKRKVNDVKKLTHIE